jgi:hypothetical protein
MYIKFVRNLQMRPLPQIESNLGFAPDKDIPMLTVISDKRYMLTYMGYLCLS